jgi:hypothetical protein
MAAGPSDMRAGGAGILKVTRPAPHRLAPNAGRGVPHPIGRTPGSREGRVRHQWPDQNGRAQPGVRPVRSSQEERIRGWARLDGHEVAAVHVELDASGARADRPRKGLPGGRRPTVAATQEIRDPLAEADGLPQGAGVGRRGEG